MRPDPSSHHSSACFDPAWARDECHGAAAKKAGRTGAGGARGSGRSAAYRRTRTAHCRAGACCTRGRAATALRRAGTALRGTRPRCRTHPHGRTPRMAAPAQVATPQHRHVRNRGALPMQTLTMAMWPIRSQGSNKFRRTATTPDRATLRIAAARALRTPTTRTPDNAARTVTGRDKTLPNGAASKVATPNKALPNTATPNVAGQGTGNRGRNAVTQQAQTKVQQQAQAQAKRARSQIYAGRSKPILHNQTFAHAATRDPAARALARATFQGGFRAVPLPRPGATGLRTGADSMAS